MNAATMTWWWLSFAGRAWDRDFWRRRDAAQQTVAEAIGADPEMAAARFARCFSSCCCCNKEMTDPYSIAYGVGPECRRGTPAARLTRWTEITAIVEGERELEYDKTLKDS